MKCYTSHILHAKETAARQESAQCIKTLRASCLIYGSFALQRAILFLPPEFLTNFAALPGISSHTNQQEKSHRPQWWSITDSASQTQSTVNIRPQISADPRQQALPKLQSKAEKNPQTYTSNPLLVTGLAGARQGLEELFPNPIWRLG